MRKIILLLSSFFFFTVFAEECDFKMKFIDRQDGLNGPVYTYSANDYDRDTDLIYLIKEAKKLQEKENSQEITLLLELDGIYGYVERVDLQKDKFYVDVESDDDYVQLLVNEDNFIKYKKAGLVQ